MDGGAVLEGDGEPLSLEAEVGNRLRRLDGVRASNVLLRFDERALCLGLGRLEPGILDRRAHRRLPEPAPTSL